MKFTSAAAPCAPWGSPGAETAAVDQDQRAGRTQTAQVQIGDTGRVVRRGVALAGMELRQLVQHILDIGGTLVLDFFVADRRDGAFTGKIRRPDAGPGNHDGLENSRLLCGGICGPNRRGARRDERTCSDQHN